MLRNRNSVKNETMSCSSRNQFNVHKKRIMTRRLTNISQYKRSCSTKGADDSVDKFDEKYLKLLSIVSNVKYNKIFDENSKFYSMVEELD